MSADFTDRIGRLASLWQLAKRAGWDPEALLGHAMKKLSESYRDKPGEYWCREAGKSMGRLFQWAFDKKAGSLAA